MVRVGLPDNISQNFLHNFPQKDIQIVRLPDQLDHDIEVEFWIPPMFGWLATPMFKHLRGVKVVQCLLAGVDWILPWLPKDIVLCDGQGIHNTPVAEWIVGAILGRIKRFPELRDRQREQFWDGQVLPGTSPAKADMKDRQSFQGGEDNQGLPYRILGDELAKKKILIVGYGGIGAEVERMIQAFDVEILRVARTAKEGVSAIGDLEKILPQADVVVLLVPLTPETRGLMNAKALALMKLGALLVNAARGPVVETDALVAELVAKRIHAVLDVTDPEPLPKGHPLWSAPNCFITPHVAGSVSGFADRGYKFAAEQLHRYIAGEPLQNRVNDAGY
jgi:phosphoglycerate dehydrogenase-like enzyme